MKLISVNANTMCLFIKQGFVHFLGLLIMLGSVLALFYLMMQYSLVCQEKETNKASSCVLLKNIYFYQSSTLLGELKKAVVESTLSSKGKVIYYINLYTDKEAVNLTGGSSSSREDKDIAVNAINSYISQSTASSFLIPYPASWWMYALTGLFFIIGLVLLTIPSVTVLFDKGIQTVTILHKSFLRSTKSTFSFSEVEKVVLEEYKSIKSGKTYRLALALRDKAPIPFVSTYDANYKNKMAIAGEINTFMGKV